MLADRNQSWPLLSKDNFAPNAIGSDLAPGHCELETKWKHLPLQKSCGLRPPTSGEARFSKGSSV